MWFIQKPHDSGRMAGACLRSLSLHNTPRKITLHPLSSQTLCQAVPGAPFFLSKRYSSLGSTGGSSTIFQVDSHGSKNKSRLSSLSNPSTGSAFPPCSHLSVYLFQQAGRKEPGTRATLLHLACNPGHFPKTRKRSLCPPFI